MSVSRSSQGPGEGGPTCYGAARHGRCVPAPGTGCPNSTPAPGCSAGALCPLEPEPGLAPAERGSRGAVSSHGAGDLVSSRTYAPRHGTLLRCRLPQARGSGAAAGKERRSRPCPAARRRRGEPGPGLRFESHGLGVCARAVHCFNG